VPTVENVQDLVEKVLIENGHAKTAKAYILYREQHAKLRQTKELLSDAVNMVDNYIQQKDWRVKENANMGYSLQGLNNFISTAVSNKYWLNRIYSKEIAERHVEGDLHIHDLGSISAYCCGWDLKDLLIRGFGGAYGKVESKAPKHFRVALGQIVNFFYTLQGEAAGAQAFSNFDTLLAPYIYYDKLTYPQIKQYMQEYIFNINVPTRVGFQTPFTIITMDMTIPESFKDEAVIMGGEIKDKTYKEFQHEADLINKAFCEVMTEGDAKGRIFSFPIPTYNITKTFNWDSENAKILFDVTAKYGTPYFQNYVGSKLDPKSIRAMCCRLNLNQNELMNRPGSMWGPGDSTGSIGVFTLNLNRMAYEAKDKQEFFDFIRRYMLLGKDSLELKRKMINKNLENGLMPYTKRYLGTFDNHFSTIGLCGMNEACMNLIGKDISTDDGKKLAMETLVFMRDRCLEFQKETLNLYNLEATPAEGTSYRFARLDKKLHPEIITSGDKEPFLTNSTQLPVDHTDDPITAIEHQNEIQVLYTGGTIFHTFVGEKISSGEACKRLVRKIAHNTRLPYFSITPSFSICKEHGYIKGEQFECPTCNEKTEVYSRIVGYYRPVQNWNAGKAEEFKHRKTYKEEKGINGCFKNELGASIEVKKVEEVKVKAK